MLFLLLIGVLDLKYVLYDIELCILLLLLFDY
jgi:hypothetical protein